MKNETDSIFERAPVVSIICPTYNRCRLLTDTIHSVQSQSLDEWELLLIDDGSDAETLQAIEEVESGDQRIRLIKKDHSIHAKGPQSSRNLGMELARGEFTLFLDSDDILLRNCLRQRLELFESNRTADCIVNSGWKFDSETGIDFATVCGNPPADQTPLEILICSGDPWVNLSCLWRRRPLLRRGVSWDTAARRLQDQFFHLQAIAKGTNFVFSNQAPDFRWVFHPGERVSRDRRLSLAKAQSDASMFEKSIPNLLASPHTSRMARAKLLRRLISCYCRLIDHGMRNEAINMWHIFSRETPVSKFECARGLALLRLYELRDRVFRRAR